MKWLFTALAVINFAFAYWDTSINQIDWTTGLNIVSGTLCAFCAVIYWGSEDIEDD